MSKQIKAKLTNLWVVVDGAVRNAIVDVKKAKV